jgi:RNA polymerase sigma-70 factor (ECF subfamily)
VTPLPRPSSTSSSNAASQPSSSTPSAAAQTFQTFERALTEVRRLNDHRKLVPWLTTVTVNACRNHLRARRRRRWLQFFASDDLPEVEAEAPSTLERPVCLAATRVLDQLDVEERLALALHYMQGLSQPEAAEAMDMSLATFKRRLAAAATRFRSLAQRDPTLLEWLEIADAH